jgi:hypothetical protein
MLVIPISQYDTFVGKVTKYREALKKNNSLYSKKLLGLTKEYKSMTAANKKKYDVANYSINKQNVAPNKADKMYNPAEIVRLENRATKNIQLYEDDKEKIAKLKELIMGTWSDIASLIKVNFSQLSECSKE